MEDIGPIGGTIFLQGVKLNIPSGALGKTTKITLGILWEKALVPDMDRDFALLGPVCCEPSGLTFKKPIVLTIPHCAVNPDRDWTLFVSTEYFSC